MKLVLILFYLFFIILSIGCVFFYSPYLTDAYIAPKWLFAFMFILLGGLFLSVALLIYKQAKIKFNIIFGATVLSVVCLLQSFYGIIQYWGMLSSYSSFYKVTGSFDNPAGFAASLCAGLPFAVFLLKGNSKYIRYLGWIVMTSITIAVVLSQSRAGIISIIVTGSVFLFQKFNQKRVLRFILMGFLILLLFGCYWLKKDSADGRLLIWCCGMEMVKDAPWTGHGIGTFEAHYMDYQAEYFGLHEQSDFSLLADNVKQPFNEYLGILLNFGIIGFLVLLTLIMILTYCYRKNSNKEKKIALYSLISIATFSLFSYPFTYPFVWIITLLNIFMITSVYFKRFFAVKWIKNVICIIVLFCSLSGIYKLVGRIQAELKWGKASVLALCESYDIALPAYKKLETKFVDNPYFLYNYAAVLLENKQYIESLDVALQCRQYWADYDLELIIGENYQQLNQPQMAEKYYKSASLMCPSRFLPLYKLFHLHKENKEEQRALEIAEVIIDKPMKIETPTIRMMKREMERERNKALDLKLTE